MFNALKGLLDFSRALESDWTTMLFHANVKRLPSMVSLEATVQSVDVIGARKRSNLFCGQKIRDKKNARHK
jgi:hypothetical protein